MGTPSTAGSVADGTRLISMPRASGAVTMGSGAARSEMTPGQLLGPAEGGEGRMAPFGVIDDREDLAGDLDHRALDLGLFLGGVGESRLEGEPGRADERCLDVDPVEDAGPDRPDHGQRLPANPAARKDDRDPRTAGELRGDPEAVRHDRQVAPACLAHGGARARWSPVVLASIAMHSPSLTRVAAAAPMAAFSARCRRSRISKDRSDGCDSEADGASVRSGDAALRSENGEILPDRLPRHAELVAECPDPDATMHVHQPDDGQAAFARERVHRTGVDVGRGVSHEREPMTARQPSVRSRRRSVCLDRSS